MEMGEEGNEDVEQEQTLPTLGDSIGRVALHPSDMQAKRTTLRD
jgi:hypothetical protein